MTEADWGVSMQLPGEDRSASPGQGVGWFRFHFDGEHWEWSPDRLETEP